MTHFRTEASIAGPLDPPRRHPGSSEQLFLQIRARTERERAHAARDECARRIHLELAHLYELRLQREEVAAVERPIAT